jgi:hypothetical protein
MLLAECYEETRASRRRSDSGAVAQLGERGLCKPEVVGSIPIGSTKPSVEIPNLPT